MCLHRSDIFSLRGKVKGVPFLHGLGLKKSGVLFLSFSPRSGANLTQQELGKEEQRSLLSRFLPQSSSHLYIPGMGAILISSNFFSPDFSARTSSPQRACACVCACPCVCVCVGGWV